MHTWLGISAPAGKRRLADQSWLFWGVEISDNVISAHRLEPRDNSSAGTAKRPLRVDERQAPHGMNADTAVELAAYPGSATSTSIAAQTRHQGRKW